MVRSSRSMRCGLRQALALMLLVVVDAGWAASICRPAGKGTLRCTITNASDCEKIPDHPYARNLFCPSAFTAAQRMAAVIGRSLGLRNPASSTFHYYATVADASPTPDSDQTTVPCLSTRPPYSAARVRGAGRPLCDLLAFATSTGPVPRSEPGGTDNPIPSRLRDQPRYFQLLYAPEPDWPLSGFHTHGNFDRRVELLGAAGHDGFVLDYPDFAPTDVYDPGDWLADARYAGISGGGGGGWGGEIAVRTNDGRLATLLAFGGGGGGGMTSRRYPAAGQSAGTTLGAGGGGGMQFATAYRFRQRSYNGLGLGSGMGSDRPEAQYSYNDYAGSGRPHRPVHEYNPAVIDDYTTQLVHLGHQLEDRIAKAGTVVFHGGGGMGGGTEYLRRNGDEFVPQALSTQGGFQFTYTFRLKPETTTTREELPGQDNLYRFLGQAYREANQRAYRDCGRDYGDYGCICPKAHAIVICLVGQHLGSARRIPGWLQQAHCPSHAAPAADVQLTAYQSGLLDALPDPASTDTMAGADCNDMLRDYFAAQNTPVHTPY